MFGMDEREKNSIIRKIVIISGSILRVDVASQLIDGDKCSPAVFLNANQTYSNTLIQCCAAEAQDARDLSNIKAQLRKRFVKHVTPPEK